MRAATRPAVNVCPGHQRGCMSLPSPPAQAVAAGAAICAGMRDGSMGDLMVLDVWQAALMRALAAKNVP